MFFYDSYDIVIVGGGISGLFLAYKLVDTDLNILVLEKEKEFGGRIHTILKNGYQYECGAARFSNKHNKLLTLIHELGLKEDIVELPDKIDSIIDGKKDSCNIDKLLMDAISNNCNLSGLTPFQFNDPNAFDILCLALILKSRFKTDIIFE